MKSAFRSLLNSPGSKGAWGEAAMFHHTCTYFPFSHYICNYGKHLLKMRLQEGSRRKCKRSIEMQGNVLSPTGKGISVSITFKEILSSYGDNIWRPPRLPGSSHSRSLLAFTGLDCVTEQKTSQWSTQVLTPANSAQSWGLAILIGAACKVPKKGVLCVPKYWEPCLRLPTCTVLNSFHELGGHLRNC